MINILYICEANINRSPAAEQIARHKLKNGFSDLEHCLSIDSAALIIPPYLGMSEEMKQALEKLHYPYDGLHLAKRATPELLSKQDLILCMENSQVQKVLSLSPNLRGKVYSLPGFGGYPDEEVHDPPKLAREIPLSFILRNVLPLRIRRMIYKGLGFTDRRDEEGVVAMHTDIAKKIEQYVDSAFQRIRKEIISKPLNDHRIPDYSSEEVPLVALSKDLQKKN